MCVVQDSRAAEVECGSEEESEDSAEMHAADAPGAETQDFVAADITREERILHAELQGEEESVCANEAASAASEDGEGRDESDEEVLIVELGQQVDAERVEDDEASEAEGEEGWLLQQDEDEMQAATEEDGERW